MSPANPLTPDTPGRLTREQMIAEALAHAHALPPNGIMGEHVRGLRALLAALAAEGETPPDDYAALYENGAGAVTGESGPSPHWPVDDPLTSPSGETPPPAPLLALAREISTVAALARRRGRHDNDYEDMVQTLDRWSTALLALAGAPVAGEGETPEVTWSCGCSGNGYAASHTSCPFHTNSVVVARNPAQDMRDAGLLPAPKRAGEGEAERPSEMPEGKVDGSRN